MGDGWGRCGVGGRIDYDVGVCYASVIYRPPTIC